MFCTVPEWPSEPWRPRTTPHWEPSTPCQMLSLPWTGLPMKEESPQVNKKLRTVHHIPFVHCKQLSLLSQHCKSLRAKNTEKVKGIFGQSNRRKLYFYGLLLPFLTFHRICLLICESLVLWFCNQVTSNPLYQTWQMTTWWKEGVCGSTWLGSVLIQCL